MSRSIRRAGGFTLLELLLASTLMAILIAGLGMQLRGATQVWQRALSASQEIQRRRVAWERLDRDLADAFLYAASDAATGEAVGEAPAVRFHAAELQWYTRQPPSPQQRGHVSLVRYWCEELDGVRGLWRSAQSIGAARARHETPPQLLLSGCESLAVRYAYLTGEGAGTLEWQDSWQGLANQMPRLLELEVELATGERLRHLTEIPSGMLIARETAE